MSTTPRDRRPGGLPPGMPTESYAARVAREESEAVTVTGEWLNSHVPGLTTSSEEKVMHACDAGCRDHAEASRVQALGEVEQLLEARFRAAWDAATANPADPTTPTTRRLWARMDATLEDLAAVQGIPR